MGAPACTEEEFVEWFERLGPTALAHKLNQDVRAVFDRRRKIEKRTGVTLIAPSNRLQPASPGTKVRHPLRIANGHVVVFSDCHYWPNDISTGHMALVRICEELQPGAVVANGDLFDGAGVSRHPPISWEHAPTVEDEITCVQERLAEIKDAAGKAKRVWCLGNHDMRFERRLAHVAPEFAGVKGVHLKDHFPDWLPAMSTWINDAIVIKHSFRGGVHARWNNTLKSGTTIVTGHTHQQGCTPFTDYNGTRYGIECGCVAEPYGPQFEYAEDNPRNWISGFVVLTFEKGRMMMPDFVQVTGEGEYEFRGERRKV